MMLPLPKKHQTIAEDKNKLISIVKREADASLFFVSIRLQISSQNSFAILGFRVDNLDVNSLMLPQNQFPYRYRNAMLFRYSELRYI